jgi:hypothetical protein
LDGLKANKVNGKQQYLMAPLVLLHKTPEDQLMPIAIQVRVDINTSFHPQIMADVWKLYEITM